MFYYSHDEKGKNLLNEVLQDYYLSAKLQKNTLPEVQFSF